MFELFRRLRGWMRFGRKLSAQNYSRKEHLVRSASKHLITLANNRRLFFFPSPFFWLTKTERTTGSRGSSNYTALSPLDETQRRRSKQISPTTDVVQHSPPSSWIKIDGPSVGLSMRGALCQSERCFL